MDKSDIKELEIAFGSVPSLPDYRDIGLAQVQTPRVYPPSFFNDITDLPVWHQRKIGACVGHAAAKYKQKLDRDDTKKVRNLSARFLYAMAKCLDNLPGEGTYPRTVAKILYDTGCATEYTCPNDTTLEHEAYVFGRTLQNISEEMLRDAKEAKISGYAFVDISIEGLKQAIVDFKGCKLLVNVGKEWYTDKLGYVTWDGNLILPVLPPKAIISGHEVYLYGYENVSGDVRFWFRNSWSNEWGAGGNGYFLWSEYQNNVREGITYIDIPDHLLEEVHNLPPEFSHHFTQKMGYGQTSEEVKWLQRALKVGGFFNNSITGYYGDITRSAVFEFKKKYVTLNWWDRNVTRGARVDQKTLLELNRLYNK